MVLEFGKGDKAQVAIVTGAARGLGKAWAIALAKKGVKVVVNDNDPDRRLVEQVVTHIGSHGGIAIADYNSVSEGDKIVENALKNFSRVDILINNAAILRDGSFRNMTLENWDAVYRSTLLGTFITTKAVWPIMRKQNYGRIINVVSASGLYGNFGQANYAAMKMGIVGFTKSLHREGIKYNIHVNAVSPVAGTRMTKEIMPSDFQEALKPELTAPVIIYLSHSSCKESGGLFELGGGWVGKLRIQRTHGVGFPLDPKLYTPQLVAEQWKEVVDFSRVTHPSTTQESFQPILSNITSPPDSMSTPHSTDCREVFYHLRETLRAEGEVLSKHISGVVEWHVNREVWTVSLLKGKASVIEGKDSRFTPDLYISMDEQDFLQLAHGKLRPQQALLQKKIRVQGNMKLAMKLQSFADLFQRRLSAKL